MRIRLAWRVASALTALFVVVLCISEAQSQRRRNRPSRRVTNPVRSQPVPRPTPERTGTSSDATLVSTADELQAPEKERASGGTASRRRSPTPPPPESEEDQLRRTVDRLATQVTRLADDLNQMRDQQRSLFDLERLTRAEQRAENLRAQLREVLDKEFTLQERAAQIEEEIQPDNIDRRAAIVGTLRPAEVREQIRRQLERERDRVRAQLEILATSRARLETAVTNADTEVERLRARVDSDRTRTTADTDTSASGTETRTPLTPEPLPTPTPPQNEPPR